MARIGILTCSNTTQELGCSSPSCLSALRKRAGSFAEYPAEEPLELVGMINCPGCPTLTGPEKLLSRIKGLIEFGVDAIHLSYCVTALCPFKGKYLKALKAEFADVSIVEGTHPVGISRQEYRRKVGKLFSQDKLAMADIILRRV